MLNPYGHWVGLDEKKGVDMRRALFLLSTGLIALAVVTAAPASSPYSVNLTLRAHKAIEFDPGLVIGEPCLASTADVTEVFNGEAHILAAEHRQPGQPRAADARREDCGGIARRRSE